MSFGVTEKPRPGRWKKHLLIGSGTVVVLFAALIILGLLEGSPAPAKPRHKPVVTGLVHLRYGQKAVLSPGWTSDGIVSATIYSFQLKFKSQTSNTPDAGQEFAVSLAQVCAGPHGANTSDVLLPTPFALLYPHDQTYGALDAPDAAREPDIGNLTSTLHPHQCVRGYVTFQYAKGTKPLSVDWGSPNQPAYEWTARG